MYLYNSIQYTQQETQETRRFLNDVKQAIKLCIPTSNEENEKKPKKVTNGFKNFIANVICEFLVGLCRRIEIYTDDSNNKNVKDGDLVKIIQLWSNSEQSQYVFERLKSLNESK